MNLLKWLAISRGLELGVPSMLTLSTFTDPLLLPKILFNVSQVFLGLSAFDSSLELKYNFLAALITLW